MFNKLKNILSGPEKRVEGPPAELPEARPFESMEAESAPAPAHKPGRIRADINHAGHMRAVAKNDAEAARLEAEVINCTKDKKTITYGEDAVSAYLLESPYLKLMTLTKNGETLCTFPFFSVGRPVDARITRVAECRNGYEGQVEIYAKGSALTFFDALYFKNKGKYSPGKDARVLISGIAYVLTRVKGIPEDDGQGKKDAQKAQKNGTQDQELAFRHENGDVDDYVFRGKVLEVREFGVQGKSAQAIRVPLRIGADSAIDIYVCATGNAIKEKIREGDLVSGIVWLQGFILDTEARIRPR